MSAPNGDPAQADFIDPSRGLDRDLQGRFVKLDGSSHVYDADGRLTVRGGDTHAWRVNNKWHFALGTNSASPLTLAATTFDSHLIAYCDYFPVSGSITDIAFYLQGSANSKCWLGVFDNTLDSAGNPYPGQRLGFLESVPGADGVNALRSGSVSVQVPAGSLVWFVLQPFADVGSAGVSCALLGTTNNGGAEIPTVANTAAIFRYGGWRTSSSIAYDSTLTTFPTSNIVGLNGNSAITSPLLISGTLTSLIPPAFYKFRTARF